MQIALIIFAGYVSDYEIASYYLQRLCWFFVGLFEGFDFPPLEAIS